MATTRAPGPVSSLKALGRTALDVLRTRAELLSVELSQEQAQLARLAALFAVTVLAGALAVQLAAILVVALAWDTPYRLVAVAGAVGAFVCTSLGCALAFRRRLKAKPPLFEATLCALRDDIEALQ